MLIDLPADKGLAHFHAINSVLNLPEFVKEADFQEQIEVKDLPHNAFADSLDRKFPVHTKAAAYMNYAYFAKQVAEMDPKARARCVIGFQKAAAYWGLAAEFKDIAKAMVKTAAPVTYKYAMDLGDGVQLYPINDASEIIKSACDLTNEREQFSYSLRSETAKNIMKAAAQIGLPSSAIAETVHKMAGFGITTKEAAMFELTRRWDAEKRPALAMPLETCINALSKMSSELIGGEVCEKIARVIELCDNTSLTKAYPEDILFAFTKEAATKIANSVVTMIDGTTYVLVQLEKAAEAFNVLGADVMRGIRNLDGTLSIVKVAEMIDTLPLSDAAMLKDALSILGVHPVVMDKHAMVESVVGAAQKELSPLTVLRQPTEKRANILRDLEAQDPLVRRALDTMRRLKTAEAKEPEEKKSEKAPTARGIGGLFIKHAPNTEVAALPK